MAFSIDYYEAKRENEIKIFVNNFIKPFDLSQAPLVRVGLINVKATRYFLVVDMHHIISDAVSREILIREFMALWRGQQLPRLPLQYKDFSEWQNSPEVRKSLKKQEYYWSRQFKGEIPILELPTDYVRPTVQSFEGSELNFQLSAEYTDALESIASREGMTLYMVLLSLLNVLFSRVSGQEDIVIGTAVAARRHADLDKIIGMFVNTLVLRNFPNGDKSLNEFYKEVKVHTLEAFENQEYPFENLVEKVNIERNAGRNPLFDVMFSMPNVGQEETGITREEMPPGNQQDQQQNQDLFENRIAKFELTLVAMETGGRLLLGIQYCTRLFKRESIERFIQYFKKIVSSVIENPGERISDIEIITAEEKTGILYEFNDTETPYPKDKTIYELFEEQAEKTPDCIAIVGPSVSIGAINESPLLQIAYKELNEKSNRLAHLLRGKGVEPDTIVGIMVVRSVEMKIGIMGIFKAGGAYLPIEPDYPEDRSNYMLKDSNAKVLLAVPATQVKVKAEVEERFTEIIDISRLLFFSTLTSTSTCQVSPANLAYIIYTSGSTGKPKGVLVEHASVVNLAFSQKRRFKIDKNERILQFSSICFDASVEQIFIALYSGAVLVLVDKKVLLHSDRFAEFISKQAVTHIHAVPSFLSTISTIAPKRWSHLHRMIAGGDVCPVTLAKQWSPYCDFYNEYGPTETTVTSIEILVKDLDDQAGSLPIGKPIANTFIYLLDMGMNPVPLGVQGELYIGGDGVARGYLNRPELTSEKFVNYKLQNTMPLSIKKAGAVSIPNYKSRNYKPNSIRTSMQYYSPLPHYRIYRTGDLARWLPDVNIEFLGRIDYQVKIRGFRIELGEIESQLLKYGEIKEAVMLVCEDKSGDKYICAYIVSHKEYEMSELRESLSKELPDYMIPSYFVPIEKIPLTPNGKIDRKALPAPVFGAAGQVKAPRDETEAKLVKIWAEVLGLPKDNIGVNASFFQLGGHSLKATIMISKLHKELEVKIPLVEIFTHPTVQELAGYIKGLTKEKYASIEPVEKKDYYVLSSAQKRLYVLQQMDLQNTAYNMPEMHLFREDLDKKKLEKTFTALIKHHESIRTSFTVVDDEPVQRVQDEVEFKIQYYTAVGKEGSQERDLVHIQDIVKNFVQPFDLSKAPLLRVCMIEIGEEKYLMILDMHHIIADGVSRDIRIREFAAIYKEPQPLPELRIQYKDFAQWENIREIKKTIKKQENFWLKEFAGEIPVLNLPTDYVRPAVRNFEGRFYRFEMASEYRIALESIASKSGATLYMLLLALFNVLFLKLTGQEDIVIGSPIAGRRHADLDKIIGLFVNTLAMRNFPHGGKSFTEFLQEVKKRTLKAFENQEYQFENLVEKLEVRRDISRNPLMDLMFVWQNMASGEISDPQTGIPGQNVDDSIRQYYNDLISISKLDLAVIGWELEGRLVIVLQYSTKLFKRETILKFSEYIKRLVFTVIQNSKLKLSEMGIISQEEKEKLVVEFNNTDTGYLEEKTIHDGFEEQVEKNPDGAAVVFTGKRAGNTVVTYKELSEISNRLACMLQKKGIKTNTIVGLLLESSTEMIISLLGILKAGGAYLPIPPDYPITRIDYILADSKTNLLLTRKHLIDKHTGLTSRFSRGKIIFLDDDSPGRDQASQNSPLPIRQKAGGLAYVIYTSGTTGNPKGVVVEHKGVVSYINWRLKSYNYSRKDVTLQLLSFSFDGFVSNSYSGLLSGGKLIMAADSLRKEFQCIKDIIQLNGVTNMSLVPGMYEAVLDSVEDGEMKSLRFVVLAGQQTGAHIIARSNEKHPGLLLVNEYGPTETTVTAVAAIGMDESNRTVIGKPLDNTQIYILDQNGGLQPIGVWGELCISGDGLAWGYLNRVELTAEKFLPLFSHVSKKIYKTGDLARWLPDGTIEFSGRLDFQVKIRGLRIEPGEIENQLIKHDQVKEAVVIAGKSIGKTADKDGNDSAYLCAYIVPQQAGTELAEAELREYLSGLLPDYMIPGYFVRVESIPLTPNGKIDPNALPVPEVKTALGVSGTYTAPANEIERKLVAIWADVLNIETGSISVDADFFQLGGHSLNATSVVSRIRREFNVNIPLVELFKAPYVRQLAENIRTTKKGIFSLQHDNFVLLKRESEHAPHLFFLHDGTGQVEGYIEFCNRLNIGFNCWGIRADRLENYTPLRVSIVDIAANYIKKIKGIEAFAHGPYFIAGWSLGGIIAFEMANQLDRQGEEIAFLAMIDTQPPHKHWLKECHEFNFETEFNYVKDYLKDIDDRIEDRLAHIDGFQDIWPAVVDYLESGDFDVESVKKLILEYGMQALPNYNQLNLRESVYYLNLGRTLTGAMRSYLPEAEGKINIPLHYFAASQSREVVKRKQWKKYTAAPITFYEIEGHHYSIFKMPHVADFAGLFTKIIKEA